MSGVILIRLFERQLKPWSICQLGLQLSISTNPNSNPSKWWVAGDRSREAKMCFIGTNPCIRVAISLKSND